MTSPQAVRPTRLAPIPTAVAAGSLVGASRASCGQFVGKVADQSLHIALPQQCRHRADQHG